MGVVRPVRPGVPDDGLPNPIPGRPDDTPDSTVPGGRPHIGEDTDDTPSSSTGDSNKDRDMEIPELDTPQATQTRDLIPAAPTGVGSGYTSSLKSKGPSGFQGPKALGISKKCKVRDRNLDKVGATYIEGTSGELDGLSWTEGISTFEQANGTDILQSFYLGTPKDFNITNVGGCALFFTETTSSVAFLGDEVKGPHGSCDWAMSEKCVDAMLKRAAAVDASGSEQKVCERLRKEFAENLDDECAKYAGESWDNVLVKSLSGIQPYNETTRKSSSCWPARHKSDDLSLVSTLYSQVDFEAISGDVSDEEQEDLVSYSVMPILTFFFPGNGNLISQTESRMTCIKPMGEVVVSAATTSGAPASTETFGPSEEASAGPRMVAFGWDVALFVLCIWMFVGLPWERRL